MIKQDWQGLPVTVPNERALAALNDFAEAYLRRGPGLAATADAADADPDCALLQAYAGLALAVAEIPAAGPRIRRHLAAATRLAGDATERERSAIAVIALWAAGSAVPAARQALHHVRTWPRDLVIAFLGHLHCLDLGRMRALRSFGEWTHAADPGNPFALGMLAFGRDQTGDSIGAEAAGRAAVAADPATPWAHHAVCHALLNNGRITEGLAWYQAVSPHWGRAGDSIYCHNWWHAALFHLAQGDTDGAFALYDGPVWDRRPDAASRQVGAVTLLSRLEMRGVAAGDRWQSIAEGILALPVAATDPFLALHQLYALARAGRRAAADSLSRAIADHAARLGTATGPSPAAGRHRAWTRIAVPLAAALPAHADGRWAVAAAGLLEALPHLRCLGGSHAQRAWFVALAADARHRAMSAAGPAVTAARAAA